MVEVKDYTPTLKDVEITSESNKVEVECYVREVNKIISEWQTYNLQERQKLMKYVFYNKCRD